MTIEKEILNYLYLNFPIAKKNNISENDPLLDSGIIDSLGVMEIVNFLIEEKDIEIDEDDLTPENFETVKYIVNFINSKMDN